MKRKIGWFFVAVTAMLLLIVGVVLADNMKNDVVSGGPGQNDTITVGGSTTINYYIQATGGSCDAADGSAATVTINTPAAVTATPGSLVFTLCDVANAKGVVFTATTAGDYSITVSVADTSGSYNTTTANFTLHVLPATDTTPPLVTCTVPDASAWYGSDVTVPCTASDAGGLANPADASFSLSTSVSVGTETASASTDSRNVCDAADNCAQAGPYIFKVDKAAPALSPSVSPNPVELNGSAVASANATDGGSGIASQSCDPVDTSSVGSQTVNCTAVDNVGNSNSASASYDVVDTTPPLVTCTVPNVSAWYGSDVSVPCTASDAGGLANPADASFSLSTSVSVGTETSSASTDSRNVCDAADNCTLAGPYAFKVDKAVPALAPSVSPNPVELNGSAVASANASDGGSGIASQSCDPVSTSSVGSKTVNCAAVDNVGNSNSASASYDVVDTTPPLVTCTVPNASVWYGSDVSVPCTASDAGGLANPSDASFSLSTSVSVGTETSSASTDSRNVCDAADNCTQAGPYIFKVDKAAPALAPSVSPNPVAVNGVAVASANASDGGSGIASQSCDPVSTSSVGSKIVNCTATDNAGNSASATANYTVIYSCTAARPSKDNLWPNLMMVAINIINIPGSPLITITGIRQDERVDSFGSGLYTPDGSGVGTATAMVRAERINSASEPGNGRVYHIYFTAGSGIAACSGTVKVNVPITTPSAVVDNGPNFDSTVLAP